MSLTPRVREILSWYASETPGVRGNIARLLSHGRLGGTGKMVILPVDQGFEHGPAKSFAANPPGYDPRYHVELAMESGCNAYAAPLGFIEVAAGEYPGAIPMILKVNNSDSLSSGHEPWPALTGSVDDALRLGCAAIGFTIYPGSAARNGMYEQLRALTLEAKQKGLAVVVWSYPRGGKLAKEDETAVDVAAYAAHIAAELGAHIIKVKPPAARISDANAKLYADKVPEMKTLADRVSHVVQAAFGGRRVVIFSGGETKSEAALLEEIRQLHTGGAFGSIVGRNAFQRPKAEAIKLLQTIMDIYAK